MFCVRWSPDHACARHIACTTGLSSSGCVERAGAERMYGSQRPERRRHGNAIPRITGIAVELAPAAPRLCARYCALGIRPEFLVSTLHDPRLLCLVRRAWCAGEHPHCVLVLDLGRGREGASGPAVLASRAVPGLMGGLAAMVFTAIGAHLSGPLDGLKRKGAPVILSILEAVWDGWASMIMSVLMMLAISAWLLVIAPGFYLLSLITGAPARRALRGTGRRIVLEREGHKTVIKDQPSSL